jgi:hypothetical protein
MSRVTGKPLAIGILLEADETVIETIPDAVSDGADEGGIFSPEIA